MKRPQRLLAIVFGTCVVLGGGVHYERSQHPASDPALQSASVIQQHRPKTRREAFPLVSEAALARGEAIARSRGMKPATTGMKVTVPAAALVKSAVLGRAAGGEGRIVKAQDFYMAETVGELAIWDWADSDATDDYVAAEFFVKQPNNTWILFYAELDFTDEYNIEQTYTEEIQVVTEGSWSSPAPLPAPAGAPLRPATDRIVLASNAGERDPVCCIKPALGAAHQAGCISANVLPNAFGAGIVSSAIKIGMGAAWQGISPTNRTASGIFTFLFGDVVQDAIEFLDDLIIDLFDSGVDCSEEQVLWELAMEHCGTYGIDWIEDDITIGTGEGCHGVLNRAPAAGPQH